MPEFRRSNRARAIGALLLALFVFGQVYAVAHRALVQHVVCPVDGELAHGGHAHGVATTKVDDSKGTDGPIVTPTESEKEHAQHCSVVLIHEHRKCLFVEPVPAHVEPAARQTAVAPLRSQTLGSRIPVLRYAPKQSPPHAA